MTELLAEPLTPELETKGISVQSISKTYRGGRVKALQNLTLEIKPGEAFGLVGPNGAGKTTFLSCLMGFLKIDSGSISIDGKSPLALATRKKVGYCPERLTFDRWMSGRDYLNYHHELAGMPEASRSSDCESLLTRVQLDPSAWRTPVRKYSRGMLQRLGFAQALIGAPKYLFLDEPASGMDPVGVMLVRDLLRQLKAEGVTILLNSHQLEQIESSCDRVAFIKEGSVVKIENLRAASIGEQHHIVRWIAEGCELDREALGKIIEPVGGTILEYQPGQAKLSCISGTVTAAMVKALILGGLPLTEIRPDEGRLERLFKDQI